MQKSLRYTIFTTKWGYFGLASTDYALYRTCLPLPERENVKSQLLKNLSPLNQRPSIKHPVSTQMSLRAKRAFSPERSRRGSNLAVREDEIATACRAGLAMIYEHQVTRIKFDKNLLRPLQDQITAYFDGCCMNFSPDFPIILDGFSSFSGLVLTACRKIGFGQTATYSALARELGRPTAARAVGNALARNPLPLIIPCHRVVRSDGEIGGFSAPGGKNLKAKLLKHEKAN